jgi:hypothetical protein
MTAVAGAPDEPSPGRNRGGNLLDLWLGRYLYGRRAMAPGVISRSLALNLMRPRVAVGASPLLSRLLARHRSALTFVGRDGEVAIARANFPELAFAGASLPLAQAAPAMLAAAPLRREARGASVAAPRPAVIQRRAMATPPRADAGLAPQAVPPLLRATKTFDSLSALAGVPVASIIAPPREQPSAAALATAIARDGDVAAQAAVPKSRDHAIRSRRIVGAPMLATALARSASVPVASADRLSAATNISVLSADDLIAPAMPRAVPEPLVTARARSLPPATDVTVLPLPARALMLRVAAFPLPVALLPASVAASEPRPPALAPLSRATDTHTAFVSSRPEPPASAAPASAAPAPAATRPREADVPAAPDVGGLAERVYQLLRERLSDERRRRGI